MHAPDKIRAVVAIEPSGAPNPENEDVSILKAVPHLFVFGDHIGDSATWSTFIKAPQRYRDALQGSGAKADWIDLPARGVKGNTHMMMMDRNSDEVAAMISRWLDETGVGTAK